MLETAGAAALCLEGGSCGCLPLTPAAAAVSVLKLETLPPTIAKMVNDPRSLYEEAGVSGAVSCVSWRGRGRLRLVRFSVCIIAAVVFLAQV